MNITVKSAAIAAGSSLSGIVDLEGYTKIGIEMPAAWDAAALTFQGSSDGVTYNNLYDNVGNEVTSQAAAGRFIGIDTILRSLAAVRYLKIRSGTSALPVNQTADRTIKLCLKA
ncbi:MAG: hypothetical protein M1343_02970 [Chloroflexi bacterium]|nr:hypothetical protein [Chloroflexota bacterium]